MTTLAKLSPAGAFGKSMLAAALILALAGCNRESVRNSLTEDQANDMVAKLISNDIAAKKKAHDKEKFEVTVPHDDFGFALQIVRQYGLPREPFQSPMCETFKKTGMISAPMEDRARMMCSKALELERAVYQGIDGVVTVTAQVSNPERDPINPKTETSHVAITIKHRPDARIDVDKVRAIARDSNAGVDANNVSVILFEAQAIQRAITGSGSTSSFSSKAAASWFAVLGVIVLLAGAAIWLYSARFSGKARSKKGVTLPTVVPSTSGSSAQPAQGDD
jgi:type III secretion protein J